MSTLLDDGVGSSATRDDAEGGVPQSQERSIRSMDVPRPTNLALSVHDRQFIPSAHRRLGQKWPETAKRREL